mgnify:FL=1|jgi:hypothetical protein
MVDILLYQLPPLQEELLPFIDTETEDDSLTEVGITNEPGPHELDTTSPKVLKTSVCGRFIYRSLPGLCSEADIDEPTMLKTLGFLTLKSLASRIGGRKGVRCHITERRRKLADVGVRK